MVRMGVVTEGVVREVFVGEGVMRDRVVREGVECVSKGSRWEGL